ncbi:response regulator [Euzebya sp.]|uniref:response regulator n=1 Tax=Euzebya sp. TaxID=1971409 RepID=UPI003514CB8F
MANRLVVIDDDPALRVLLSETMALQGFDVDAFGSGAEAIEKAEWGRTGSALIDWMMPGMSGVEVVDWLAAHHPDVRRIIVTAAADALLVQHPEIVDRAAVLAKTDFSGPRVAEMIEATWPPSTA